MREGERDEKEKERKVKWKKIINWERKKEKRK